MCFAGSTNRIAVPPSLDYPILYPADIGATRGTGPLLWLSQHLIEPKTDRIHFFIIGDYLPWDNDYVILESIGKGIAVGRLSFYNPMDVEIYRVVLSETPEQRLGNRRIEELHEVRKRAAAELTRVGRACYDYILIAQIAFGALTLYLEENYRLGDLSSSLMVETGSISVPKRRTRHGEQ